MMFESYWKYFENEANEGRGVVIVPSYVSYLGLLSSNYTDIILADEEGRVDFGTEEARINTTFRRNLSDKLIAFFISVYESGIDGRGYQTEAKQLIVHNKETNFINSIQLGTISKYDYFCRDANYRFVNDTILEVKSNRQKWRNDEQRYGFETKFTYHQILVNGSIIELLSNRYYDFTKFILIDESNLKGCFAERMQNVSDLDEYNMWLTDHLSLEDLEMMRNEIFAEYGYKFKTEKWQEYFSQQPWYNPRYDDVNDRLTEIDKANVKFILEIEEKMKDDEGFINKRPAKYVAAG
jgi:hypothetical protein